MPAKKKPSTKTPKPRKKAGKAAPANKAAIGSKARKGSRKAEPKIGFPEARAFLHEVAPLIHPAVHINARVLTDAIGMVDAESLRRVRRLVHEAVEKGQRMGMEVPPAGRTWDAQNLFDMTPRLRRATDGTWKDYSDAAKLALSELLHGAMLYGAGRSTGELAGYTDPTVGGSGGLHPLMKEFKGLLSPKTKAQTGALAAVLAKAQKDKLGPKMRKALKKLFDQGSDSNEEGATIDRESWVAYVPAKWFDALELDEQQALYDLGFGAYRHGTEMHPYMPPGARDEVRRLDAEVARTAAGPDARQGSLVQLLVQSFKEAARVNDIHPGETSMFAEVLQQALTSGKPKAQEILHRIGTLLPRTPARGQDTLQKALGDVIRPVLRRRLIDYLVIDNVADTMNRLMKETLERGTGTTSSTTGSMSAVSEVVAGWHNGILSDQEAIQQIAAIEGSASRSGQTTGGYVLSTGVNSGPQSPYSIDGRGPFLTGGGRGTLGTGVEVIRGSSIPPVPGSSPF